jgi:hypothetical protein
MTTIHRAHVSHGRTDDQHSWRVHVDEVSLWRIWLSGTLEHGMHTIGMCCGIRLFAWTRHLPDWLTPPFFYTSYRLLNWAARIDNGWLHKRYTFDVTDAWAKEHAPDFWADIHDLYADEDEGVASIPATQVWTELGFDDEATR